MGTRPRTKALKANQLKGELKGDLAAYEKFGLFQRSVNQNTAYRYRGALLRYQIFLGENPPSLAATCEYLGLLRKNGFDPSTLRVYRAALAGYHQWRNEELKFKVKVPETSVKYIPWEIIQRMLELASAKPHDELILRLMTDAGLRRDEVVHLKLNNLEGSKLRFRDKGGKERMVPMTDELQKLVDQFSAGRPRDAYLVELGEKGVYLMVKRYGVIAGMTQDKFVAIIEAHYQGRRLMRRKLGALHEMAKASIGIAAGARSVASEIAFLVEKLAPIKGHIGTIERTLVKLVDETEEGKYLLSITGLNYIAVAGLLAELGCFRSYRTAKQMIKMAGSNPTESESAGKRGAHTPMSKQGRPVLRYCAWTSVIPMLRFNTDFRAWANQRRERPAHANPVCGREVVGAAVNRLLRLAFALVKNQTFYRLPQVVPVLG